MSIKSLIKARLGGLIKACLAEHGRPLRSATPILMEWDILLRSIHHFEQRRETWRIRGSKQEYRIGHYFEFGCYEGDSLVDFYNVLCQVYRGKPPDYWKMFAFDSFEGLPATTDVADLHPHAGQGSYKARGVDQVQERLAAIGCGPDRLRLVKGYYENSLTPELRQELLSQGALASFVNIDCDYYSSTMSALNWVEPLLVDGSIVYFDDIYFYNCNPGKGELKAITDFNRSRPDSGLAVAPFFDRAARCYMYWRNEKIEPHAFEFKAYVKG